MKLKYITILDDIKRLSFPQAERVGNPSFYERFRTSRNDSSKSHAYELLAKNEKGIALVMVLILALISLALVSALLYMMTQGTTMSGGQKFYRTAEEASYGGMELAMGYISGRGLSNLPANATFSGLGFTASCNCGDPYVYTDNIDNITGARSDRCDKLCNPTANWPVATRLADTALIPADPTNMAAWRPDFTYTLGVAPATFTVFAKIVDTVQGNSDVGGLVTTGGQLGGAGVVEANITASGKQKPYLYRLEVQGQATVNPRERARLSVLYAY